MDGKKLKEALFSGIIKNNPVFVLVLGMCPTLAMTTSLSQAFAMGVATLAVLVCSNTIISLLRGVIPQKMRIPSYIVVISTFVIMVEMIMRRFLPDLYATMRTFISLIVVNCIILARAESYASKNAPLYAAADGLSMGVGFTLSLSLMGAVRELLTTGGLFGATVSGYPQMEAGAANAVGFIVLAFLMAGMNALKSYVKERKNRQIIAAEKAQRRTSMDEKAQENALDQAAQTQTNQTAATAQGESVQATSPLAQTEKEGV